MQQQLNFATQRLGQTNADAENMRNRNPYVEVLIDGDGMVVRILHLAVAARDHS